MNGAGIMARVWREVNGAGIMARVWREVKMIFEMWCEVDGTCKKTRTWPRSHDNNGK